MASLLLPGLHNWLFAHVLASGPSVRKFQRIPANIAAFPASLIVRLASQMVYTCFLIPFCYLNWGMEAGNQMLLIWCITTYCCNFVKDLLMLPRLARIDPGVGIFRNRPSRGLGNPSTHRSGRIGARTRSSSEASAGGRSPSSSFSSPNRGGASGNSVARGAGRTGRSLRAGRAVGRAASDGMKRGGGSSSSGGGGGNNNNNNKMNGGADGGSGRGAACFGLKCRNAELSFLQRYNFSVEASSGQQQEDAVLHSYGLPSTQCATGLAVALVILNMDNSDEFRQSSWYYCLLLTPYIISAAHIYLGRDSPPSVCAGWMIGGLVYAIFGGVDSFASKSYDSFEASMSYVLALGSDAASISLSGTLWRLVYPFVAGMLLLMAYPVPHKYDAGATFPRTASAVGFTVGMVVGSRILKLVACQHSEYYSEAPQACFMLLPKIPAATCGTGAKAGVDSIGSDGVSDTTVQCAWATLLRALLGIFSTLGTRLLLSLGYALYCRSKQTGALPSWSLFQPRLSGAAISILRGADHRFNPSEDEAASHLATLNQNVPLAASGTPISLNDKGVSQVSQTSLSSDLSAPQPPSPEEPSRIAEKRGRRAPKNKNRDSSFGRNRVDSSTEQRELEAAAAAAAALSSRCTGSVYGKYESAVPWNYFSNLLVGVTLSLVSPIVVSMFGG